MNTFLLMWRLSRILPVSVTRALAAVPAWLAWVVHAAPVKRLEHNLHRVTGLEGRELRKLSRKGMASAGRYYAETFELGRMTPEIIDARIRIADYSAQKQAVVDDGALVVALGHSANWDIVGAFTTRNIATVTAVAEVLKPQEVYEEFVRMREATGMRILGLEGSATFRKLLTIGRTDGGIIALVADRSLSGEGIEVDFAGHRAKVAPGPAATALTVGCKIAPLAVHYERLTGERRKAAKSRWGVVMTFGDFVSAPEEGSKSDKVLAMSQQWIDFIAAGVKAHPEDWHMLQRFGWLDEL